MQVEHLRDRFHEQRFCQAGRAGDQQCPREERDQVSSITALARHNFAVRW